MNNQEEDKEEERHTCFRLVKSIRLCSSQL